MIGNGVDMIGNDVDMIGNDVDMIGNGEASWRLSGRVHGDVGDEQKEDHACEGGCNAI
jgi:hypothetical protein